MIGHKFAVVDASFFTPFDYSIKKGVISVGDLSSFLDQTKIELCVTNSILKEIESICYITSDPLTFRSSQISSDTASSDANTDSQSAEALLSSSGTMTNYIYMDGLEFRVFNTSESTPDMSNISLAYELMSSGNTAAILTNDERLRREAKHLSILFFGSCSFLAGMVLSGKYTDKKATKIFYKWKMIDQRWVPKDFLFKDVLSMERKRVKDNESFWFNKD